MFAGCEAVHLIIARAHRSISGRRARSLRDEIFQHALLLGRETPDVKSFSRKRQASQSIGDALIRDFSLTGSECFRSPPLPLGEGTVRASHSLEPPESNQGLIQLFPGRQSNGGKSTLGIEFKKGERPGRKRPGPLVKGPSAGYRPTRSITWSNQSWSPRSW